MKVSYPNHPTRQTAARILLRRSRHFGYDNRAAAFTWMFPMKPIDYPTTATEFEIQAYIYHELKRLGYDVRGEVGQGDSRFDLVVFDADKLPIRVIEVKKYRPFYSKMPRASIRMESRDRDSNRLQLRKYDRFGIRVDVIAGMPNAEKYIRLVAARGFLLYKSTELVK